MVLLAVRMVADVTKTRNVIPSLEFKTSMTNKSQIWNCFLYIDRKNNSNQTYLSTIIEVM